MANPFCYESVTKLPPETSFHNHLYFAHRLTTFRNAELLLDAPAVELLLLLQLTKKEIVIPIEKSGQTVY
jgi:hypothetical protein